MRYFSRYCHPFEKLELFLMFLNSREVGLSKLYFLDLKLTLKDNKIQTTLYSKPTNSHLFSQADFCHHLPSTLGIEKGVALRLCRICSNDEEYNNKSKEYKAYLTGGGHKLENDDKSFNYVLNMSLH